MRLNIDEDHRYQLLIPHYRSAVHTRDEQREVIRTLDSRELVLINPCSEMFGPGGGSCESPAIFLNAAELTHDTQSLKTSRAALPKL